MSKKESKFDRVKADYKKFTKNPEVMKAVDMAIGAGSGMMAADKLGGTGAVSKLKDVGSKAFDKVKSMRSYVKEKNEIDAIAKSKGLNKVKSILPKKSEKFINKENKDIIKKTENLRAKDVYNSMVEKQGHVTDSFGTTERGFTSRGKQIGKKIEDQGGKRRKK